MKIYICFDVNGKIIGTRDNLVLAQSVAGCLRVEEWTQTATVPVVYTRTWNKVV